MGTELNLALADQPLRVRALWNVNGTYTTLTDWTLLRDGVVRQVIAQVWAIDASTTELALGEPLLAGTRYTLSHTASGRAVDFAYNPAPRVVHPELFDEQGDPEAEAFGVDTDWLTDNLTATRDLPAVRGTAALKHDLAALAVTNPGELVHRPAAGIGLRSRVNGLSTEETISDATADVSAAYLADDRVRDVTVNIEQVPAQALVRLRVNVLTPQLAGESIDFVVRV